MDFEKQGSGSGHRGGLFDSLKTLASTLVSIGRTRLELLSVDIEEERVWLSSMLVWTLVALFCAGLSIVLTILFFIVIWWDTHRLLAVGMPALLLMLCAILAGKVVLDKARAKPRLFAASLAELSKDHEHLSPPHEQ